MKTLSYICFLKITTQRFIFLDSSERKIEGSSGKKEIVLKPLTPEEIQTRQTQRKKLAQIRATEQRVTTEEQNDLHEINKQLDQEVRVETFFNKTPEFQDLPLQHKELCIEVLCKIETKYIERFKKKGEEYTNIQGLLNAGKLQLSKLKRVLEIKIKKKEKDIKSSKTANLSVGKTRQEQLSQVDLDQFEQGLKQKGLIKYMDISIKRNIAEKKESIVEKKESIVEKKESIDALSLDFKKHYDILIPKNKKLSASILIQKFQDLLTHPYLTQTENTGTAKEIKNGILKKIALLQEPLLSFKTRENIAQAFQKVEDPFDPSVVVDALFTHVFNAPESEVSVETKTAIAKKYGISWTASNLKEQLAEGKKDVQVGNAVVNPIKEDSDDMEVKIPAKTPEEKELIITLPKNIDTKTMREQINTVQLYNVLEKFGLHEVLLAGLNLRTGDKQIKPHHIEQAQRIYSLILGPAKNAGEFRAPQELNFIRQAMYFFCKNGERTLSPDKAKDNLKELGILKPGENFVTDDNTDFDLVMAYAGDNLDEATTIGYKTAMYIVTGKNKKPSFLSKLKFWNKTSQAPA